MKSPTLCMSYVKVITGDFPIGPGFWFGVSVSLEISHVIKIQDQQRTVLTELFTIADELFECTVVPL